MQRLAALVVLLAPAVSSAAEPGTFSINGYSSFEVEYQWSEAGEGDRHASMDADLFDLVFNFRPTDQIRVATDITWEHGVASEDGRGNAAIEYGFAEYALSDGLKLRAGKMFTPFGVFNEIHTAKPAYLSVKEAASTNKPERIVDSERFFPRWGVGVAATGDLFIGDVRVDYHLMVSNGEQEDTNPYEEDNNLAKAVTARTRVESGPAIVGVSLYADWLDGGETIVSTGVQGQVVVGSLEVMTEGVYGTRGGGGATDAQVGVLVQTAWRFDGGWTPYLRGEVVDPDLKTGGDRGTLSIVGVNLSIDEHLFIKLEHDVLVGGPASSLQEVGGTAHELKFAVVVGFQ